MFVIQLQDERPLYVSDISFIAISTNPNISLAKRYMTRKEAEEEIDGLNTLKLFYLIEGYEIVEVNF